MKNETVRTASLNPLSRNQKGSAKKAYAPPSLAEFGKVSQLTQAGTQGQPEMMSKSQSKKA
jgi:hypothetical protein